MIRFMAAKILSRSGFEVCAVESGIEGLRELEKLPGSYDLVLMDFIMTGLSGTETLQKMREIAPDLPCIMSSGNAMAIEDLPAEIKSDVHFLQKPYRANQLTELVEQFVVQP